MRSCSLPLAVAALAGCAPCGPAPPGPIAWRLVDFEAPAGRQLVLEPDLSGPDRIEIRLTRERAGVGEIVEAEVRLPGATGRHTIEIRPNRPGVRILGPCEIEVEGDSRVVIRFTSDTPGLGGLLVSVRERR